MMEAEVLEALRQQLVALKRSLADMTAAGVDEALLSSLRAQIESLQGQITLAIGEHSVAIGGNATGNTFNMGDTILDPEKASREELLRAYYRQLAGDCRHLPLGTVDPKFAQPTTTGRVALHQVYVGLDVVAAVRAEEEDARAWGLRLARGEGGGRTPLLEALAEPAAARAVLLGDPGSGKSTFVNYLTYRLAGAAAGNGPPEDLPATLQNLWPARLILREVARFLPPDACGTADMLWQALQADLTHRLGEVAAKRLLPHLQARLLRRGWFLLDGLDEVPAAHRRRQCLLEAIQALLAQLNGGRVLLTARPYAYAEAEWQVPGLPVLALAPFDERQVESFVAGWYAAVEPIMGWSVGEATARGAQLRTALEERPRLGDLASRPLLLTLMATLHTSWGQLPDDRADLYEESVKLLLARWQRARMVRSPEGETLQPGITAKLDTELQPLRRALERLAYEAHREQGAAAERDEAPADIAEAAVLAALCDVLPGDVNAKAVLPYLKHRAGLLLERRPEVYAFPHRSFQEYLAACYLADEADFAEKLCQYVEGDVEWWREVFLLGVVKAEKGGLANAVHVINTLVPAGVEENPQSEAQHWRNGSLAGQALVELGFPGVVANKPGFQAVWKRIRRWLVALVEGGHLVPRERLEAGDVLGRLGDPRPGVGARVEARRDAPASASTAPDILWCEIPAGPFLMGSSEDEEDAYDDEKPQHELTLPTYYIARYPVTNAQFRPFVEGDGYENPVYWTEQGWAWRQGAEADLTPLAGVGDEDWQRQYREWLAGRPVEKRDRPFWWGDGRWGAPTRPVVGITWFEAVAYTHWLENQLHVAGSTLKVWTGEVVREVNLQPGTFNVQLPSEAEWEKAARGAAGRRYPWGDEWLGEHANTEETELKEINPVGLFPAGASPYGALEMAGNVWEWTRSRWGERSVLEADYGYPYDPRDGREQLEDVKIPILRGGSWSTDRRNARCAFRSRDVPDYFDNYYGFRVVVSLVRG